jgi:hypothetical protein
MDPENANLVAELLDFIMCRTEYDHAKELMLFELLLDVVTEYKKRKRKGSSNSSGDSQKKKRRWFICSGNNINYQN